MSHCLSCGKEESDVVYLKKHHLLSYKLAKIILESQIKEKGHGMQTNGMKRLRKVRGDVFLCSDCHDDADRTQNEMIELLRRYKFGLR